ncbi:DNA ligase [Aliarcobacter lanthieri]|uniref:DNA ligase n=1 Tax=Aliarcobacter lanthieri TaxID=1355374 RepID=UPI00047C47FC|nr:DNA ligase [Aliarcobacter lanthieri]QKF58802.1 DNA ligase [Aliarcobacter lanthieri]
MKLILILIFSLYSFAIDLQKATIYDERKHNINSYYMSEKLDGIRAYWSGEELQTKNGNKIFAPKWFIKDFPPFELDGELFTKQNDFENIQSIVLSQKEPIEWENISYNIFEVPNQNGDFQTRLNFLKNWLDKNPNKFIKIIPQIKVNNIEELNDFLNKVLTNDGEGVILKNYTLDYFTGKSDNVLKVKKFFDDEAEVISHNLNKNGSFKSLKVRLKNGVEFNLGNGFKNSDRLNPPKVGSIITFKYFDLTKNGKPKFASFLRIRQVE